MGLSKLVIVVEEPDSQLQFNDKNAESCITALFNPSHLSLVREATWVDQKVAKRDTPELQFTGAPAATLSVDLFFDTYDSEELEKASVRTYTDRLRHLTTVEKHGDKHRPPVCQLKWGQQSVFFQGVLTHLDTQYTLFMEDGTPVRAACKCSFLQWRSNTDDLRKQDLMSADIAKLRVLKQGQTLASIAASEYGDPREWRRVADANDIDDPMSLRPGDALLLPPRHARANPG